MVSNHAGTLRWEGRILHAGVHDESDGTQDARGDLIFKTPYSHDLARKTGTTLACQEDAERLLAGDQLVAVFPEGFKGLGKPYVDRYKLQRFGRGGFVSAAVRAQVPIIPVSIVGSEEIYPLIRSAPVLARALGGPSPDTPLFRGWLLGLVRCRARDDPVREAGPRRRPPVRPRPMGLRRQRPGAGEIPATRRVPDLPPQRVLIVWSVRCSGVPRPAARPSRLDSEVFWALAVILMPSQAHRLCCGDGSRPDARPGFERQVRASSPGAGARAGPRGRQ